MKYHLATQEIERLVIRLSALNPELDLNVIERISVFTKKHGITEFMFFIANYYLFLAKKAQQDDIIIAATDGGRSEDSMADVIGMFVNVILMRFKKLPNNNLNNFFSSYTYCVP